MQMSALKKQLFFLLAALMSASSAVAQPEQDEQPDTSEPPPWYAVQAIGGVMTTGECVETMSAVQILEAVKLGMAHIVSEKKSKGKVTQLTFAYQGVQGTIYRDKETCQAVARAVHKKKTQHPIDIGRYVGELRDQCLATLRAADQGQFGDLIAFARS